MADIDFKIANGQSYNGIKYNDGSSYSKDVFLPSFDTLLLILSDAEKNGNLDLVLAEYNSMQDKYAGLRNGNNFNLGAPQFNLSVADYLNEIKGFHNNYLNEIGINNAFNQNRYNVLSKKPMSGDRPNDFTSDGLYGGVTQDRTLLGFEGDWDEKGSDFLNVQQQLSGVSTELYLDPNTHAYKFRRKQESPEVLSEAQEAILESELAVDLPQLFEYTPQSSPTVPPFKKAPWSDWIDILSRSGIGMLRSIRNHNLDTKLPTYFVLPALRYSKITDDYYKRSALFQKGKEGVNLVMNNLTSDINQNERMINSAKDNLFLLNQNALLTEKYDLSIAILTDNNNFNNAQNALADNENRKSAAAKGLYILQSKQKMNAEIAENIQKTITAFMLSRGKWAQLNRLNKLHYDEVLSAMLYELDINTINDEYQNLLNNPFSSEFMKEWYDTVVEHPTDETNLAFKGVDFTGLGTYEEMMLNPEMQRKALEVFSLDNSFNKRYSSAFDSWKKNLESEYEKKLREAKIKQYANKLNQQEYVSNLLNYQIPIVETSPLFKKQGGLIDRLKVEINRQNNQNNIIQKELDSSRRNSLERNIASQKKLLAELEAINKKQLALLKIIYR